MNQDQTPVAFMTREELAKMLNVSKFKLYRLVKSINEKLPKAQYIPIQDCIRVLDKLK